ncbi:hypothetical protein [Achromobacter xylosoxidans]|uniref:hypothetical protein n=1 Tax=Alcaligenes xylosoxydans xylosoxydans TaxID=85698 RepID=UPI000AE984E3|nr:hypothetical protein [Achromobacter xylosoxidans]
MSFDSVSLAFRGKDGQFQSFSPSLTARDLIALVLSSGPPNTVVDFQPVIGAVHELHKKTLDDSRLVVLVDLHTTWRDARTYTGSDARFSRWEAVIQRASELLARLKLELNDLPNLRGKDSDIYRDILKFNGLCSAYLESILYFIHAKASVEVTSFVRESALQEHVAFLRERLSEMYSRFARWCGNWEDFLVHLAIYYPNEAASFYNLEPNSATVEKVMRDYIKRAIDESCNSYRYSSEVPVKFTYRKQSDWIIGAGRLLRDSMHALGDINRLLEALKTGEAGWMDDTTVVESLAVEVRRLQYEKNVKFE